MINIYAPINNLGYGVHANNMIKALTENGQELTLTTIGEVQLDYFFEIYAKTALQNKEKYSAKNPSVHIFHDEFSNAASGKPLLAFSIFETSQLKQASLKMVENGPSDVILTTTQAHADLLKNQKVSKPIEVVNEGIDDTIFNTIPVDKYIDTKKFTYLTVGKKEERKNTDSLIRTFCTTMKEKECALICHTFNPFINNQQDHPFKNLGCWTGVNVLKHGFEYKGFNGKAHTFSYKTCDILFTLPTLPTASMASLYHSANVGIQVSRGEGWDLPLTEMLACGLPVIATDCLGHSEYLPNTPDIQKNLIIPKKEMTIAFDNVWFKGDQGIWDVLDTEILKGKLEETFTNATLYESKCDPLADYMSQNYSWNAAAKQLIDVITKYKG